MGKGWAHGNKEQQKTKDFEAQRSAEDVLEMASNSAGYVKGFHGYVTSHNGFHNRAFTSQTEECVKSSVWRYTVVRIHHRKWFMCILEIG